MSSSTNAEARALRDALRRLIVEHGALDEACRPCGAALSLPHAHALLELRAAPRPLTVGALARRLRIDRTNVSRLCAKLEALGHLERSPDPDDGRAWALSLTREGRALAAQVDRASLAHFRRLAERLEGALPELVDALERLRAAIRDTPMVAKETT